MTEETKRSDAQPPDSKPADTEEQSAQEAKAAEPSSARRKREKRKESAHPPVHVWHGSRYRKKRPAVPEEKEKTETPPTGEEQPEGKSGRKLWLKVEDSGRASKQKPPAGHEKHRHLTSYRAEEQDEQRRRIAEFRQRKKMRSRALGKSYTEPTRAAEKAPEPELSGTPIEAVYTIALQRTSPQKFMQKLADAGISLVFDLRSDEAMLAPGFAKGRDLAILLKEAAGIDYRRDEVLVPRGDLMLRYTRDKNIARFAQNYAFQLAKGRVENIIDREIFAKHKVAFIGEAKGNNRDQSNIAAEYLKDRWGIYSIIEL